MPNYTTQKALRAAFWEIFPNLSKRKIPNYSNIPGSDYLVDTRVTWCDWIDSLERDGEITTALADRATL
jgi:hypothetical protein